MRKLVSILAAISALGGCASIDRPYIVYQDSPGDQTKERIYAWTPGAAAAIGVDQYNGTGSRQSGVGVKYCVLTAAAARTSSSGFTFSATGAQGTTASASGQQAVGALLLKNEGAAATFLDVGMFHLCMLNANPSGLTVQQITALMPELFKQAGEVAKHGVQFAPLGGLHPDSAPALKPAAASSSPK